MATSWGFRDARRTERRRRRLAVTKFMALVAGLITLGLLAYQSGAELVRVEVSSLREEIRSLNAQIAGLNARVTELDGQRRQALAREAEANARYQREVPTGPSAELFRLAQARIAAGVPAERVAFALRNVTAGGRCDNRPGTRRFQVRTAQNRVTSAVSFDNGAITIVAEGEVATNDQGAPQAWFDLTKPVRITFTQLGGARTEAAGVLPVHHSVVRGESEWRFTLAEADLRGFVTVTGDRCDYP